MKDLHPYLFQEYMEANATIPQVSDGIKWRVHYAYLKEKPVPVNDFAFSQFSEPQLLALKKVTTAIHRANNIPWQVVQGDRIPEGITPLVNSDFQILMTRVRNSFVNNIFHYINGESGAYKNDLEHDLHPPSKGMIFATQLFLNLEEAEKYTQSLRMVVDCLKSPEGKDLLTEYRDEFKHGKRTSAVWRTEGHGSKFAHLVKDAFIRDGFDLKNPATHLFLRLNNLTQYPAFGGIR